MKIVRVFNNNAVLVSGDDNSQRVLIGKGIGFGKKEGDIVLPSKKIQAFIKDERDPEWVNSLATLINEVPIEYIVASKQIIENAENKLKVKFNPFLQITLADHIYFAVKRNNTESNILTSVKDIYPDEYEVAKEGVTIINQTFNTDLSAGEVSLITIHFVENEINPKQVKHLNNENTQTYHLSQILKMIVSNFGYPQHDLVINRLTVHLRFLLGRAEAQAPMETSVGNQKMLDEILQNAPQIKLTLSRIVTYFSENLNYKLYDGERLYLALHLRQVANSVEDE